MAKDVTLVVDQGGKFEYTVQLQGVTLPLAGGWTAKMVIADHRGTDGVELASYTTADYLSVVGAAGQVQIDIPHAVTGAYTWDQAVYDLYAIEPAGAQHRILQGHVRLSRKVN